MTPDRLLSAIRAALDETERIAREVGGAWRLGIVYGTVFDDTASVTVASTPYEAAARHIVHHDPAAVLRRVAADREIVDAHPQDPAFGWCLTCRVDDSSIRHDWPCPTLRALADGLGIDLEGPR